MVTTVQKWGNSQGLRLTLQVLDSAGIATGDEVDVSARDGMIVIVPVRKIRGKYDLNELVKRIPKNYRSEEVSWGEATGKEMW